MSRRVAFVVLAALLLAAPGCTQAGPPASRTELQADVVVPMTPPHPGGAIAVSLRPTKQTPDARFAKPGVYPLPAGRTQVLGTAEYGAVARSAPGWWVVGVYPWETSKRLVPLVRLAGDGLNDRMYSQRGRFVSIDGVLDADGETLTLQEMWPIGTGGPWRQARMEKPHQTGLAGERLRVVGLLAYVHGYRDVVTKRWGVMLAIPGESPFGTAHVGAFLESTPTASFSTTAFPYVAAEGRVIDSIRISGTPWPVIRVDSLSLVPTQPPAPGHGQRASQK